jgi:hypothetical protein
MRGDIPPFPNTPSWCRAQLKHRDNFTFTFTACLNHGRCSYFWYNSHGGLSSWMLPVGVSFPWISHLHAGEVSGFVCESCGVAFRSGREGGGACV